MFRKINGRDWYQQQALRAVNQAIGRVIRHSYDYGAIILVDERFGYHNNQQQISTWLREKIVKPIDFRGVYKNLLAFFKDKKGSELEKMALKMQYERERQG